MSTRSKSRGVLISFLISLSIVACSKSATKASNTNNIKETTEIDSSSIVITVARGAFHYDSFVLKDTLITFYPSSDTVMDEGDRYSHISTQVISKQARNAFIKKIMDADFFELKGSYTHDSSCLSQLVITCEFNKQLKKVISDDYIRGCPEILQFIENEMVRLHNKNLQRFMLPG